MESKREESKERVKESVLVEPEAATVVESNQLAKLETNQPEVNAEAT
jgi:hypothetical protein